MFKTKKISRYTLPLLTTRLLTTTIISALGLAASAQAQNQSSKLEEVIVTAQKREESLQKVPVAVTALTEDQMAVNRVANLEDLAGLAPNTTIRETAGGASNVSFSMRGITSYGALAGTDKEVSTYLDGVYLGSPRGSLFTLPDIQQVEVLRGPQGTLFGRNATAGAVSITTRDPKGVWGFVQELNMGNRDLRRTRTSIDLPAVGPLSVAATYASEKKDGDIKNLGAGASWNRAVTGDGTQTSPKYLGSTDSELFFLAALFEPSAVFSVSYKFDYGKEENTPHAAVPIAQNSSPLLLGPQGAAFFSALLAANPQVSSVPNARRPDEVNNNFSTTQDLTGYGHNLTAVWELDKVVLKNIASYRESDAEMSGATLDGLGGMTLGFLGAAFSLPSDTPVCTLCAQTTNNHRQWSDELQLTYDSELMTLTTGALYYDSEDSTGDEQSPESFAFAVFPGFNIPTGSADVFDVEAKSTAVYVQSDFHLTEQLDLVAGYRWTKDEKSGTYQTGLASSPRLFPFDYEKNNPSYVLGLNYSLTYDILLYAKYSTAFVSGGSIAGSEFEQEDVTSYEAGMKGEFLDGRLRTNLAVFDVTYEHIQSLQSGLSVGRPEVSVIVADQGGDVEANGFELEVSALPLAGLTLTASLGYTDVEFTDVSDTLRNSVGGNIYPNSNFLPTLIPEWTGNLSAHYDTKPLFDSAYLSFSLAGDWHSKIRLDANPGRGDSVPQYEVLEFTPESWVVNARAALREINLGNDWQGEVALWGRNLTDNDYPTYALIPGGFSAAANFMPARSYGVDFQVKY